MGQEISYTSDNILNILSNSTEKLDQLYEKNDATGRLIKIDAPATMFTIGDLHGDYTSFKQIFSMIMKETVKKGERMKALFLGDFIDRGPNQIEVIVMLLELFNNYPENILLLRGNHEGPKDLPCHPSDFGRKLRSRFPNKSNELLKEFEQIFNKMPHSAIIEEKAIFMHGGIPIKARGLKDIAFAHQTHPEKSNLEEILWNDPLEKEGFEQSPRGAGKLFGPDITHDFLDKIEVDSLIRGHQACPKGYKIDHDRVLTLFSCKLPRYSNITGAVLRTRKEDNYQVQKLEKSIILF